MSEATASPSKPPPTAMRIASNTYQPQEDLDAETDLTHDLLIFDEVPDAERSFVRRIEPVPAAEDAVQLPLGDRRVCDVTRSYEEVVHEFVAVDAPERGGRDHGAVLVRAVVARILELGFHHADHPEGEPVEQDAAELELVGVPTISCMGNRDITFTIPADARTPSAAPRATMRTLSARNCQRMDRWVAPTERLIPISLVRSCTTMYMMFATPIPPTLSVKQPTIRDLDRHSLRQPTHIDFIDRSPRAGPSAPGRSGAGARLR